MAVRPIDANALARRIREYMDDFPKATTRLATCRVILSMLGDENQTPTLTQPNEQLTLDDLREMDGQPVWVKRLEGLSVCDTGWAVIEYIAGVIQGEFWGILWPGSEVYDTPLADNYGKTWLAYRRPPEGEEETP